MANLLLFISLQSPVRWCIQIEKGIRTICVFARSGYCRCQQKTPRSAKNNRKQHQTKQYSFHRFLWRCTRAPCSASEWTMKWAKAASRPSEDMVSGLQIGIIKTISVATNRWNWCDTENISFRDILFSKQFILRKIWLKHILKPLQFPIFREYDRSISQWWTANSFRFSVFHSF